ncbi:hypothetical protein [Aliarcobacter butzleri]|uniref:hypothetical protein n=1 Tax=Aliarcobacter butzleri TaxID=28197 RepID=UPI003BB0CC11
MYKEIRNEYFFTLYLNNELYFFPELENYIKIKVLIKRVKPNSLKTILSSIKSFIIWSLANPSNLNEELVFCLSRYLSDCENGFKIYNSIFVKDLNETINYEILSIKQKQPTTIDKDKSIIEDFLKSTNQELFKSFNLEKNIKSLNYSFKNSVHDGYGLRMGSLAQKAFANDISIIHPRNKSLGNDFKSFPYQLFNSLLEISPPREKLIYLLCGACSGRISQVLNLTLYDFDYKNKHVWLIDPRSNDQLGIHGIGRKTFLQDVYNIDAAKDKPHSNIGFKAPIPLRFKNRVPLYWISDIYRNLFFDILADFKFIPESSRIPKHPFFFVTNSGARLTPQQVHVTFTSHCEKLKKIFPEKVNNLDSLGLHSLRHMFGVMMAIFQAKILMNKKDSKYNIPIDQIKIITKEAMGHKSLFSTDVYFNRPWHLDIELGEHINTLYDEMMKSMSLEQLQEKYDGKRLTKRK